MKYKRVTRLIIAQGPLQLLNVISLLRYQLEKGEFIDSDDFLIIGDLALPSFSFEAQKLKRICVELANLWSFKRIFYVDSWLRRLFIRNYLDYQSCVNCAKTLIGLPSVDMIYAARNWQFINEILLSSYPEAKKICYGDGLGSIDVRNNSQQYTALNPNGFQEVDNIYSIIPVVSSDISFSSLGEKIELVDPLFFVSAVGDGFKQINGLANWLNKIKSTVNLTLVLTSNHTEAGFTRTVQDEVACYLNSVLSNTNDNDFILVKRHPRQAFGQAKLLVKDLRENGRKAFEIKQFSHLPVELLIGKLNPYKIIFCASSSCMSSALLMNHKIKEFIIGYGESLITKYFVEKYQKNLLIDEYVRYSTTKKILQEPEINKWQLDKWQLTLKKSQLEFHQIPLKIKVSNIEISSQNYEETHSSKHYPINNNRSSESHNTVVKKISLISIFTFFLKYYKLKINKT